MTTKDIDVLADRTTAARFARAFKVKLHEAMTLRFPILPLSMCRWPKRGSESTFFVQSMDSMRPRSWDPAGFRTPDMESPIHGIMHPMLVHGQPVVQHLSVARTLHAREKKIGSGFLHSAPTAYLADSASRHHKDAAAPHRAFSNITEWVFLISRTDAASAAWYRDQIDVFQAIPPPGGSVPYARKFAAVRYPQMLEKLAAQRAEFSTLERERERLMKAAATKRHKWPSPRRE